MSKLIVNSIDGNKQLQHCILEPAKEIDMAQDWTCRWPEFWTQLDPACDDIIKLSYEGETQGLVKIGLYPFPFTGNPPRPEYVEIGHLETASKKTRPVNPVGFWLIWYAARIALKYCTGDCEDSVLKLDAYKEYLEYYRDKIGMDLLGEVTIAPEEEGYALRFTRSRAAEFYARMGDEFGHSQASENA